jgi:hypothetical protein
MLNKNLTNLMKFLEGNLTGEFETRFRTDDRALKLVGELPPI